jgi:hypothetical protein
MEDFAEPASFDQNRRTPGSSKEAIFLSCTGSLRAFLLGAAGEQEENALERPLVDRRRN